MHADYIANPLYDNNPFIEALPPMLSGKDLIRALAVIPPYSDSDRDRSTGERLQLLSSLYEFYQPLSMTVDLYCEIHTAMQHCYGQYSVQSEAATFQNGYSLMHGNALAASIGGGNSFSVVGVSVSVSIALCTVAFEQFTFSAIFFIGPVYVLSLFRIAHTKKFNTSDSLPPSPERVSKNK